MCSPRTPAAASSAGFRGAQPPSNRFLSPRQLPKSPDIHPIRNSGEPESDYVLAFSIHADRHPTHEQKLRKFFEDLGCMPFLYKKPDSMPFAYLTTMSFKLSFSAKKLSALCGDVQTTCFDVDDNDALSIVVPCKT
jgi:hypothetical protein